MGWEETVRLTVKSANGRFRKLHISVSLAVVQHVPSELAEIIKNEVAIIAFPIQRLSCTAGRLHQQKWEEVCSLGTSVFNIIYNKMCKQLAYLTSMPSWD